MQRIFLIGYMGAGKTTVGRQLALALGLDLVDLDHFIEKRYNRSISQIFSDEGEEKFRKIEASVLKEVANFENVVISTGGGAPCFYDNMQRMNEAGTTIYLKTSPGELAKRLVAGKNSRPLLADKSKHELESFIAKNLLGREPFYSKAKVIFNAEQMLTKTDVKKITDELVCILNGRREKRI